MTNTRCGHDGCATAPVRRGYCWKHYNRLKRHGDTSVVLGGKLTPAEALEGALDHIDANGCWVVQTPRVINSGYGVVTTSGRRVFVHRLSYEVHVGPIPDGLVIDHLCRNRRCYNPDHLEPVTNRENVLRSPISRASINAARTHCPSGHEYAPENTYIVAGARVCKACRRDRYVASRAVSA